MNEDRGYVIRCHDLWTGITDFWGLKGLISPSKSAFSVSDTYTLSGAKRTLTNMRRDCFDPDRYQYSIERLEEYYLYPSSVRDIE